MALSKQEPLTSFARFFLEPANTTHRQYEALRAVFVEGLSAKEVAHRFGYTEKSVRVMAHDFRQNPHRSFFLPPRKGPRQASKRNPVREKIVRSRKQNASVYDIQRELEQEGHKLSAVYIDKILKQEGFAPLPRRSRAERPERLRPEQAPTADVKQLDLSPQRFSTRFGGLFLFFPYLSQLPWERLFDQQGFPGSSMIPAACAIRSLLGLKLFGAARHSHVMSLTFDPGLALFAGLNTIPKRSFLTEYSSRIAPETYPAVLEHWLDTMQALGLPQGESFDLDFHTIPFHGEDALMQKHYVSKRSRRQKGILAFVAQDADEHVFCYSNAQVRKETHNDEIRRFAEFWHARTGHLPKELIFDSKLTTYANLNWLTQQNIRFITLRRRSKNMLQDVWNRPRSAWRQISLEGVSRAYRSPRILDEKIYVPRYQGPLRQIVVTDLGHEEPTFLLTNQLNRSAPRLIERYAGRMMIENNIQDGIDFFHMDALSSAVPMKVDLDLLLTIMASGLYRLLGRRIGQGYERVKSRTLFRDFVDASAKVEISDHEVTVRFQKRAHNPYLIYKGFDQSFPTIPWLGNRALNLVFG